LSTGLAACLSPFAAKPVPPHPVPSPQIAQFGFGDAANYVRCTPPACPTRTPKTLDIQELPVTQEMPPPVAAVPKNETLVEAVEPAPTLSWSVPFTFGSAQIGPIGRGVLQEVLAALPKTARIHISGRTDSTGPALANETLATARAKTVRDHLAKARPDLADAMDVDAQGDCCFVAPNDTPTSRARNRRVDVVLKVADPIP
jgi:outer membrane protein OmpA-like peptidoglycan-associated protein